MPLDPTIATGARGEHPFRTGGAPLGSMSEPTVFQLLDYLYWMRDRVLATAMVLEADAFQHTPVVGHRDLRQTLAHELDVEMSWRGKLRGQPRSTWGPEAEVKPEWFPSVALLADYWHGDEGQTRAWVGGLSSADLAAPVTVNGLDGRTLATYLMAVVTHGITELVAASAILEQLGHPTGDLGLLNFLDATAPVGDPDA
jgi:uncharacterized damage-inducible protein DinB